MSRLVPHPLLSAGLTLVWLMLTRFSPGHLLLGGAIALLAGWTVERLHPPRPRIRRWQAIPRLAGRVACDVIVSNLAVARAMVAAGTRLRSGFVPVRLELRDRNALAVLAIIITATPGTCWLEYDPETGLLLLHVLELDPDEDWQARIRGRYESLLMEIFE